MLNNDSSSQHLCFLVSEDWYFCSHRLELAKKAIKDGFEVSLITRVDNHGDIIREAGINLIPLDFNRTKLNLISDVKVLIKICRAYRVIKPDIVHHVALKPVIYGSIAALMSSRKHIINALGGLGYVFSSSRLKARILRPVVKLLFSLILRRTESCLIVQNRDDFELFANTFKISPSQIKLVRGSGVDSNFYQKLPEPVGKFTVTLLARMLVDKGVYEFVQAARICKDNGLDIEFLLVGDPDPMNPASISTNILEKWNSEGDIKWSGFQNDISRIWADSHLSVLPSFREGLPKSLLESAACGRAIVTSDVPGCREIVIDGYNGLLVPPKNPDALAAAIQQLYHNDTLRKEMGGNGRRLIEQELSSDIVQNQLIGLYRRLLTS